MKFTLDWRELVVRVVQGFLNNPQNITAIKVLMEGKLIAVAYILQRTYWNQHLILIILIIHIKVSYDQNIS